MTRPRAVALALILVAGLALAGCATVTAARVTGYPSTSINVPLAQVACTLHDACVAVGTSLLSTGPTSTAEYRRTNGSWVALRAPVAPTSSISAVACARSRCLFGGTSSAGDLVWLFTSSPPRLTALAPPPDGIAVEAISCVGASTCE
ncbi:MAG: hypothetical protein ACRDV0_05750, partial [Acidimicrobiales bacterium]